MAEKDRSTKPENLVDLDVPVAVIVAERSIPLSDILDFRPGVVIELERRCDQPLDLHVNGSRVGSGRAVDAGDRLGFLLETVDAPPVVRPPGMSS
jgi:flagellar motor switch protein FliN/FliY